MDENGNSAGVITFELVIGSRRHSPAAICLLALIVAPWLTGCGSGSPRTIPDQVTSVQVSAPNGDVASGGTVQFTVVVSGTGNYSHDVVWSVNGVKGGNQTFGTISTTGLFAAPQSVPSAGSVTVTATSVTDASKKDSRALSIDGVQYVYLNPSYVSLQAGTAQQFDMSAVGSGNFDHSVKLYVNDVENGNAALGTITAGGLYSAPAVPPVPNSVTLKVVSVLDPSKFATAQLAIILPTGSVTVTVSPSTINLAWGATQQFTALVTGTQDHTVAWHADLGTVDGNGFYTAPASGYCNDNVVATSEVDPTAQGIARVACVPADPHIDSISGTFSPGNSISITGENFFFDTEFRVYYTGPNGVPLYVRASPTNSTGVFAPVPLGATTGPIFVKAFFASGRIATSNSVTSSRIPHVRMVPDSRELAAGESMLIHARITGDNRSDTFTWTADVGSVAADGTYTAPTNVPDGTVANVTACTVLTVVCQNTHIRVHPFRINPFRPVVALSAATDLTATQGGTTVVPSWDLWGPGSLLSTGHYTAGTTVGDSGMVPIHASYSGSEQRSWVGVTGGYPGETARIYDFLNAPDYHANYSDSVVVAGNRIYAIFSDDVQPYTSQQNFYLDVYDITDIAHPVWLDSVEPVTRPDGWWVSGNTLYMRTSFDYLSDQRGIVASYDISSGTPVLSTYYRLDMSGGAHNASSVFWCGVYFSGATAPCSEFDAFSGSQIDYQLPIPSGFPAAFTMSMSRVGNRLYLAFDDAGPDYHLLTYDVSVSPPVLLDTQQPPTPPYLNYLEFFDPDVIPVVRGTEMAIGCYIFDISAGIPQLQSIIPVGGVLDWSGKFLLGTGPSLELREFDLSNPAAPVWLNTFENPALEIDSALPGRARLSGGNLVVPSGRKGLAIYNATKKGGLQMRQMTGHLGSAVFDQTLKGNILYSGEAWSVGGALQPWDVGGNPPIELNPVIFDTETPYATALDGNYLFVGTDQNLHIFDVSSQTPVEVNSLPLSVNALLLSGHYLYASVFVSPTSPALQILDVSNPQSPVALGVIGLPGSPVKMAISGNLLYAAADLNGLLVCDVSQPSSPQLLVQWQPATYVEDVIIDGTLALLAAADRGVMIADISQPTAPTLISATTLPQYPDSLWGFAVPQPWAIALALDSSLLYVGTYQDNNHVYVFDYRNQSHPRIVSITSPTASTPYGFIDSFLFTGTEAFWAGWNDDGDGFTPPGIEARKSQPGNVILMHPLLLESVISSPSAQALNVTGSSSRTSQLPQPLHPKLRRRSGKSLGIQCCARPLMSGPRKSPGPSTTRKPSRGVLQHIYQTGSLAESERSIPR